MEYFCALIILKIKTKTSSMRLLHQRLFEKKTDTIVISRKKDRAKFAYVLSDDLFFI